MSQQQEQFDSEDGQPTKDGTVQHRHQPSQEGHGGQGSDSAMKQMREWEKHRANNSGGRHRHGQ
jgi:hypothetical protein